MDANDVACMLLLAGRVIQHAEDAHLISAMDTCEYTYDEASFLDLALAGGFSSRSSRKPCC
jgi:hypothetical protein